MAFGARSGVNGKAPMPLGGMFVWLLVKFIVVVYWRQKSELINLLYSCCYLLKRRKKSCLEDYAASLPKRIMLVKAPFNCRLIAAQPPPCFQHLAPGGFRVCHHLTCCRKHRKCGSNAVWSANHAISVTVERLNATGLSAPPAVSILAPRVSDETSLV